MRLDGAGAVRLRLATACLPDNLGRMSLPAAPFGRVLTAMVTPFDAEGAVDVPALERYVDWQIASGIHGLIPLGSTGEFLSLSDEEQEAVAETVIRQAAGRVPVLIGAGRPLFGDIGCDLRLTCLASQAYPSGMVSTRYRVEAGGRVMVRNGGGDE